MDQFQFHEIEDCALSAWVDAVAETAPKLMPEKLPPELSPVPFDNSLDKMAPKVSLSQE